MQACPNVAELDTRVVVDGPDRSAVDFGALRVLGGGVRRPAGARVAGEAERAAATSRRWGSGDLTTRFSEVLAMEVLDRLHQLDLLAAGEQRSVAEVALIRSERWPCPVWTEAHRRLITRYPPPERP